MQSVAGKQEFPSMPMSRHTHKCLARPKHPAIVLVVTSGRKSWLIKKPRLSESIETASILLHTKADQSIPRDGKRRLDYVEGK
jgi:hypothetical protein